MRYNSITLICSLCILFSFLILPASAQRRRDFNTSSDLSSTLPIESRLNTINKILQCIIQQEENIYSPELIRFANEKFNNINEDIFKEDFTKYIQKKEDEELIHECQKFKYNRTRSKKNQQYKNSDSADFRLNRRLFFREFYNRRNKRKHIEINSN